MGALASPPKPVFQVALDTSPLGETRSLRSRGFLGRLPASRRRAWRRTEINDAPRSVGNDLGSSARVPSAIVLAIQPIRGFLPETAHVLPVAEDRGQDPFRRIGLGLRQLNDLAGPHAMLN